MRARRVAAVADVMTGSTPPVVALAGVRKQYGGLRPLRLDRLVIGEGERVSVAGLDAAAAEVFVSLLTGAVLPDEGEIRVLGESTAAIANQDAWLASLDRFGILSSRAVLLTGLTVAQNLALPFTVRIDPIPRPVLLRLRPLAAEVGLAVGDFDVPAGESPPETQMRVHLARALAFGPRLLLAEQPTARLPPEAGSTFGNDVATVAAARGLAVLAVTGDQQFAEGLGGRRLTLDPGSGRVTGSKRWRQWLGRSASRLG